MHLFGKSDEIKKTGSAWLENKYNLEIEREAYFCTFKYENKQFTVVSFHAITKNKQPETEIKYFKFLPEEYPSLNLIFTGDFNCPQSNVVFNPLKKMGYKSILINQKTSLKRKGKENNCLASEFDNMYYKTSQIKAINADVIPFYKNLNTLNQARIISDHIPIWFNFSLN